MGSDQVKAKATAVNAQYVQLVPDWAANLSRSVCSVEHLGQDRYRARCNTTGATIEFTEKESPDSVARGLFKAAKVAAQAP